MNAKLYRIKPLEWERKKECVYEAATIIGRLIVFCSRLDNMWQWGDCRSRMEKAPSLDAAKLAAERHYVARMEEGLEEVKE